MPDDLYGDDGGDQGTMTAERPGDTPTEEPSGEKTTEGTTALIDKNICPGMEPGDEMVVKIEKVMDKEYLVSYAPEPGKGESEEGGEAAAPEQSSGNPGGMSSMYE